MKKNVWSLTILALIAFNLASCTTVDPDETSAENPSRDTIIRKKQLTRRYNCEGDLVSEKIETTNSLSKTYRISPDERSHLWGFTATGVSSGDSHGALWGTQGQFTVDLAPTVFNIKINPGLNEIKYTFSYCYEVGVDPVTGDEQCAHTPEETEPKSFWLDIEYKVVELNGAREFRPSEADCQP